MNRDQAVALGRAKLTTASEIALDHVSHFVSGPFFNGLLGADPRRFRLQRRWFVSRPRLAEKHACRAGIPRMPGRCASAAQDMG
jgi:hypothetical protein